MGRGILFLYLESELAGVAGDEDGGGSGAGSYPVMMMPIRHEKYNSPYLQAWEVWLRPEISMLNKSVSRGMSGVIRHIM